MVPLQLSPATHRPGASGGRPGDAGFTLIEVLVVIIILGILSAIAIPMLMGQRQRAADATSKSDLRSVGTLITELRTADQPVTTARLNESGLRLSPGTAIAVHEDGPKFCLLATHASGDNGTQAWIFTSTDGLGAIGEETCSGFGAETLVLS